MIQIMITKITIFQGANVVYLLWSLSWIKVSKFISFYTSQLNGWSPTNRRNKFSKWFFLAHFRYISFSSSFHSFNIIIQQNFLPKIEWKLRVTFDRQIILLIEPIWKYWFRCFNKFEKAPLWCEVSMQKIFHNQFAIHSLKALSLVHELLNRNF